VPNKQRGINPAVYVLDPFCSQTCCREWYGIPLLYLGNNPAEKRGKHERVAA